jgi:hypothetical protein
MQRMLFVLAAAASVLFGGTVGAADFAFGFEGCPASLEGQPGDVKTFDVYATLTTTNNEDPDGAQGWSFSIRADGATIDPNTFKAIDPLADPPDIFGLNLQVSTRYDSDGDGEPSSTPPGTPLKDPHMLYLYKAGFLVLENAFVTQKPDRPVGEQPVGAVCAIVLHQTKKMVLQPTGTQQIAHISVTATVPAAPGTITLSFEDGLFGSGEEVRNVVTFKSTSCKPVLGTCTIPIGPPQPKYILSVVPGGSSDIGTGDMNELVADVDAEPGVALVPVDILLQTENLPVAAPGYGPQGWSICLKHDSCMSVDEIILDELNVSTLYDDDLDPETPEIVKDLNLAEAKFSVAQLGYPTKAADRPAGEAPTGVVSAIVLNTERLQVLHPNVLDRVLRVVFEVPVTLGTTTNCTIWIENGLFGQGEAVKNVITYDSESKKPTTARGLAIKLTGVVMKDDFIRGDANNDGGIDIADAIYIVYEVVPGMDPENEYSIVCLDAGDANADGMVNLADTSYLVQYQFMGGLEPTDPYPDCGTTEASTELTCPAGSTACP